MYEDRFQMTYIKDGTDRTKKVSVQFEDVKKFVKEVLGKKTNNYVEKAYNKAAENDKDKETKSGDEVVKRVGEKAKDMVEKKDDLPDQPLKSVGSIKKQSDHSVKGTKQEYKYPKQKNNKLVVKLPSKKTKSKKS
jgi:cation transport regulator ChaB